MEAARGISTSLPDPCILLGGQPRSGTSLLTSMLRESDALFQAFELHIRKPSFVVGNGGNYTRNIFKQLGLPPEEFDAIVRLQKDAAGSMNLGAWTGPKEEVSAELLTGNETSEFERELQARGVITTHLMRRVADLAGKNRWGFKILGDIIYADKYASVWPNACFVLLVRDPRDHALSVMKLNAQRAARGQQLFMQITTRLPLAGIKPSVMEKRYLPKTICGILSFATKIWSRNLTQRLQRFRTHLTSISHAARNFTNPIT